MEQASDSLWFLTSKFLPAVDSQFAKKALSIHTLEGFETSSIILQSCLQSFTPLDPTK